MASEYETEGEEQMPLQSVLVAMDRPVDAAIEKFWKLRVPNGAPPAVFLEDSEFLVLKPSMRILWIPTIHLTWLFCNTVSKSWASNPVGNLDEISTLKMFETPGNNAWSNELINLLTGKIVGQSVLALRDGGQSNRKCSIGEMVFIPRSEFNGFVKSVYDWVRDAVCVQDEDGYGVDVFEPSFSEHRASISNPKALKQAGAGAPEKVSKVIARLRENYPNGRLHPRQSILSWRKQIEAEMAIAESDQSFTISESPFRKARKAAYGTDWESS